MKKLLVTLAAVMVASLSVMAQGVAQITVDNRNLTDATGATYQAPINGNTTGATAQLFLFQNGAVGAALTPPTTFRTGAAAAYLTAQNVDVTGVTAGGSAQFVLRAWVGNDYDSV
jgi:hypothetical protein